MFQDVECSYMLALDSVWVLLGLPAAIMHQAKEVLYWIANTRLDEILIQPNKSMVVFRFPTKVHRLEWRVVERHSYLQFCDFHRDGFRWRFQDSIARFQLIFPSANIVFHASHERGLESNQFLLPLFHLSLPCACQNPWDPYVQNQHAMWHCLD